METKEYEKKITSAHISKPRFMAWLRELLTIIAEAGECANSMNGAFNIDTANGVLLDVIGATVGAQREVGGFVFSDDEYRNYIRAKILQNTWDGTNESLPLAWQRVFPALSLSYTDNQNMTMTVTVSGDISDELSLMIQAGLIIPRPAGISQTFIIHTTTITSATVSVGTGLFEYGNDEFVR